MDLDLRRWRKVSVPQDIEIDIDGRPVAVAIRINPRARHLRLSVTARGGAVLTLPKAGHWRSAQAFLERHRDWLSARLDRQSSLYSLVEGGTIPLRGVDHRITGSQGRRGLVMLRQSEAGQNEIAVPGGPEHLPRRLTDWLKDQARADLEACSAIHADRLGVSIAAIRIRDQSTRWGSCSSARVLNFNWRLIMAPPFVLDYVAAHEVAHIIEMNHQPAYWRTLARTLPDYARGRDWLKTNGAALMAV